MKVRIYKNTNFGNNDLVWNVPHPLYDFDQNHDYIEITDYETRFPLLKSSFIFKGEYDFDTTFYDYMILEDNNQKKVFFFVNAIVAERGNLILSVTLDVISTHKILSTPISGVLIRKHDTNPNEGKFDYSSAVDIEGNFTNQYYSYVGYDNSITRLIESTINLSSVDTSINIPTLNGDNFVIPRLPKPNHVTKYNIKAWSGFNVEDDSRAFTLYLADSVNEEVLNTVRGMAGDGAISDSYIVPSEGVTFVSNNSEVLEANANFVSRVVPRKMEIDFSSAGWTPKNPAIRGAFKVKFMSLQEKTVISFPAWDLQESVTPDGNLRVNLWCDPKPSGAPYCCPDQVLTLYPEGNSDILALSTLEQKSVRGGQWLRNPLIYSSGKGELFASVETQLQREASEFEKKTALQQLELARREREIDMARADYEYQSNLTGTAIGGMESLFSKDIGGLVNAAKGIYDANVGREFVEQMRGLKQYEQESQKTLINMANANNLRNLDVQESLRRVVPREVAFSSNESLGSYDQYNGFLIIIEEPDMDTLKAKDMEYSKYGYPVYETVNKFVMLDHLRRNHTVYQFEKPLIEIGGTVGDMIRTVLEGGIRILSKPYTIDNILDNPKE